MRIKQYILITFVIILMVGLVSAFEFDNIKRYDAEKKEVTIENAFGLGKDIAKIRLNSNLIEYVAEGYNKIAEIELTNLEDYNEALKQIDLYNKNDGNKKFSRQIDYYKKVIREVDVDDSTQDCYLKDGINHCKPIEIKTHKEMKEVWEELNTSSFKEGDNFTIGLFTDVQYEDNVEWIPTFYGVKIDEWAGWINSMNVGLMAYWAFESNSNDFLGIYNLTVGKGTPVYQVGKVGNGVSFNGADILMGGSWFNTTAGINRTYAFWLNGSDPDFRVLVRKGAAIFMFRGLTVEGIGSSPPDIAIGDTPDGAYIRNGQWHLILFEHTTLGSKIYVDNVLNVSNANAISTQANSLSWVIGGICDAYGCADAGRLFWSGQLDEFGIWNRTLSDSEKAALWNGGAGTTASPILYPEVTLNTPINWYNSSSDLITFNCTVGDLQGTGILNASLYIDTVINYTITNNTGFQNLTIEKTLSLSDGNHSWNCKGSDNNEKSTTGTARNFSIDATSPVITIDFPIVADYNSIVTAFNFTATDTHLDKCWYSVDEGATNTTFVCGVNVTGLTANQGWNNWFAFANDTFGNRGQDNVSFFVDSIYPDINFTIPTDTNNSYYLRGYILANVSATDTNLVNITMVLSNLSGILNKTTTLTSPNYIEFIVEDGAYFINATACDTSSQCNSTSSRNITIDTTSPVARIVYPINNSIIADGLITDDRKQVNITWVASDTNLDSCWFFNGTTNISLTCADTNYTWNTTYGEWDYILYVNDSLGFTSRNTTVVNYTYAFWIVNWNDYNHTATETLTESFSINVSYHCSWWNSISGKLNYNGSNYTAYQSGAGDELKFSSSLSVPPVPVNTNLSLYWIFILTNVTGTIQYTSNSSNQSVNQVTFTNCTIQPFINFTMYDAIDTTKEVNATFKSSWDIRLTAGTGTTSINRTYQELSGGNHSWGFCLIPPDKNYTISASIEYDAVGYAQNYYYLNGLTITNTTTNVKLYILNDSFATLTVLEVVNEAQQPFAGVYITIQKYDTGTDTLYTIGTAKTDANGQDLTYLNWYDTFYKFIVVRDGSVIHSTSPYKISATPQSFVISTTSINPFTKFYNFEYDLYFNETTDNFVLTFIKPSGEVDKGCLMVIKRNVTNDYTICETCETSNSATVYCNIAGWGNGTFIGSFYATGSYGYIDMIVIFKGVGNQIYELIGNADGTVMAIIFAGLILSFFLFSPVLAIIGMILGLLGAYVIGFQAADYTTFTIAVILGGFIIWLIKK